jgi:hypothetical protein
MQSPTGVLFRTLVMLACLVAIPMAALFGSSLPNLVTAILAGHWPLGTNIATGPQSGIPEPAPCIPNGGVIASPAEPASPLWQQYSPKRADLPADTLAVPPSPVTPAAYEATSGGSSEVKSAVAAALPDLRGNPLPASNVAARTALARPTTPAAPTVPAASPGADASSSGHPETSTQVDYFSQIQQRLRQLGATYYLLETWGNQRDLFRFYCEVPIGGSPNFVHHFEATHAEPLQAMAQVLREVESRQAVRP